MPTITQMIEAPRPVLTAFMEALKVERAYREAAEMTEGSWPVGQCVEASLDLWEVLRTTLPAARAHFVYGAYMIRLSNGTEVPWGHAWVELRDEVILDLTQSQFHGDCVGVHPESTVIVFPTDRLADRYVPEERDPAWAVRS